MNARRRKIINQMWAQLETLKTDLESLAKDEEYCFNDCEWRNLHFANHETCDNCQHRDKCKLYEFMIASEEEA